MDKIIIGDLLARCIIGVNDEERREKQDVLINITLFADLNRPSKSDRFEETVDYRALKKEILAMTEGSRYFLLEALAEAVSGICLAHPMVSAAQVRVDKPGALRFARTVGVEIRREKAP